MKQQSYRAIGIMSGTSLDGLDIAFCQFDKERQWKFRIVESVTISYPETWKDQLITAPFLSGEALQCLHTSYGRFIGKQCADFIRKKKISGVDLIACHGHTIFHQVDKKFTFQLGDGNAIHAAAHIPVVYDFRALDVALGGQGAPLVPAGDHTLFGSYDMCLNLGGIGNISMVKNGKRIAFDICYANMGLNYLASKANMPFDRNGKIAASGNLNTGLQSAINDVYKTLRKRRPALGREGFEQTVQPLLDDEKISLEDRMMTFCSTIADEVLKSAGKVKRNATILATGGGALNPVLLALLRKKFEGKVHIEVPDRSIIEFKEAMVFAFLGVLRLRGDVNVFKTVTRASRDSCSGVVVGRLQMK